MTREEAIDVLKNTLAYESDFAEAKQMAIEALSAEAKGDLISRDVVLANIGERLRANGYGNVGLVSELNRLIGYVRNIPSAETLNLKDSGEAVSKGGETNGDTD